MKRLISIILIILCAAALFSCVPTQEEVNVSGVTLTARIISVSDKIEAEVTDSENGMTGIFWINYDSDTVFTDKNGSKTDKTALVEGCTVTVTYSGQVMMSYPPQIYAKKIQLK